MGQPHKHAALIKAWADGAEIEAKFCDGGWENISSPSWAEWSEYRIKPQLSKYPQTNMTFAELGDLVSGIENPHVIRATIANAAIARAIEDKQVFTADSVKQALEAGVGCEMVPVAMLEKVAHAVKCKAIAAIDAHVTYGRDMYGLGGARFDVTRLDLPAIIAFVREDK